MQSYEKLGVFYLGRRVEDGTTTDEPVLYDARDLTTHAVCVGMTGSGKTGLCLALLEEAAIDGIPAIAIDPKGDIGNLLLTFPSLRAEDFAPWIDPGEAAKHGQDPAAYAAMIAERWRAGLRAWDQEPERIARLRAAADFALYTPGSTAGRPIALLRRLSAPPAALRDDVEAVRDRVVAAVSGILALAGMDADPVRSREHILLSLVLDAEWSQGRDVDLGDLIRLVQNPGMDRVGVLDLETFFPAAERAALALRLNNLLASPGFAAWTEGEPLDIQRLLWTAEGRPRVSVLSIAHLSDAERMFFVTLLLSEIVGWMRTQSGSATLRALVYMDEVFGFFPPTANPPSKTPMLTLLKQARAFGLGVVLATQNPVDLDYKGLGNAGTWFLGRLQTERDKLRVLDGLESAGGGRDRAAMDALLSALRSRVFLMHNVHEERPLLMETRWVLSYLRGPLSREEIRTLTRNAGPAPAATAGPAPAEPAPAAATPAAGGDRPAVTAGVVERFAPLETVPAAGARIVYRPSLLGRVRLHYVDARRGIDHWHDATLLAPLAEDVADPWAPAASLGDEPPLDDRPGDDGTFAPLPASAGRPATWTTWRKSLESHAHRSLPLVLYRCAAADLVSSPGETVGDFRVRLAHRLREMRDAGLEKLRQTYAPRLDRIEQRIRRHEDRVERERAQHQEQKVQAAVSFGTSLLGAVLGRRRLTATNLNRAGAAVRGVGRVGRERADVARAEQEVEEARIELERLEAEFAAETETLQASSDPANATLEELRVAPRKSDIDAAEPVLVWVPWIETPDQPPRRGGLRATG